MSKLILTTLGATAVLALIACGHKAEENNMAVENVEDLNAAEDMNMDGNATEMSATGINDMNASDTGNATGNETTGNSY